MKSSLIALTLAAAVAGVSVPAVASPFGSSDSDSRAAAADRMLNRIQERGYDATSVEEWGHLVRAFVTEPDGSRSMVLFEPRTLTPVTRL